jgi:hypothetical protein
MHWFHHLETMDKSKCAERFAEDADHTKDEGTDGAKTV